MNFCVSILNSQWEYHREAWTPCVSNDWVDKQMCHTKLLDKNGNFNQYIKYYEAYYNPRDFIIQLDLNNLSSYKRLYTHTHTMLHPRFKPNPILRLTCKPMRLYEVGTVVTTWLSIFPLRMSWNELYLLILLQEEEILWYLHPFLKTAQVTL